MKKAPTKSMLFLAEPAKKDIFAVSRMNSNSCVNHSVAVHIIKTMSCISSIPEELYIIIAKENTVYG